jgi:excisionase family DNA binding protein
VITLEEAAHRLGISSTSIRRLIDQKLLPATQVVACAPWEIPLEALENPALLKAVENIKKRVSAPQTLNEQNQHSLFSNS